MSKAAAATADAVSVDAAPKKGKKKLIVILAVVLLLVLGGGGAAAVVMMKKKAAAEAAAAEEDGEGEAPASASASHEKRKHDPKHPPVFVPLEPFVVNLADKESDRYAQVGVTLEVEDAKFGDEMKAYMPAIRNGILMVLSHKTSTQLLSREGKLALAREIMREAALPMGIEADEEEPVEAAEGTDDEAPKKNKKRKKAAAVANPIKAVHFSNFIVQ